MADKRGAHQRGASDGYGYSRAESHVGAGQQPEDQRAAYERAYREYMRQHEPLQADRGTWEDADAGYGRQSRLGAHGQTGYQYQQSQYTEYALSEQDVSYGGGWSRGVTPKKKGHPVRNAVLVVLLLFVVVGVFAGFTGFTLYNSAKTVKADASAVLTDIGDLKDQIIGEQPDMAKATAADIQKRAANMKGETSSWAWTVASYVPVYGSDVQSVRELSDILDALSSQAITPLVEEASQVSVKNMIGSDGSINVAQAQKLISALDDAAPVITQSADRIAKLPEAHLEQIARPLDKAKMQVANLETAARFVDQIAPTFTQMLGADGQPRTYLVVAQTNSEIRSTGGMPGSIGSLTIDNGTISLGDFRSCWEVAPNYLGRNEAGGIELGANSYNVEVLGPLMTEEELNVFGDRLVRYTNDMNFVPDWSRAALFISSAWEFKGYGEVAGVIGVDPVFLQDLMAMSGASITAPNGIVVDGSNAATILLHDAYYLPVEEQDPFFEAVAAAAFKTILESIGDVSMTKLMSTMSTEIDNRRLFVWMKNPDEEAAMVTLGCDGALPHDETKPVMGFFVDDESYSKIFWYLKVDSSIGEPTVNPDGSKTYPVSVSLTNMLPSEAELSSYIQTHNKYRRSDGDMIETVVLTGPEGGRISDVQLEGYFVPADVQIRDDGGAKHGDGLLEGTLQGLDTWYGVAQTLPGETTTIRVNVTTSPNATEPLKVIRTSTAQEVAGW